VKKRKAVKPRGKTLVEVFAEKERVGETAEDREALLRGGIPCQEGGGDFEAADEGCQEIATHFDAVGYAWCNEHGPRGNGRRAARLVGAVRWIVVLLNAKGSTLDPDVAGAVARVEEELEGA
jgi:hypothetical protein